MNPLTTETSGGAFWDVRRPLPGPRVRGPVWGPRGRLPERYASIVCGFRWSNVALGLPTLARTPRTPWQR
jgi:hypothetical protein